MRRIVIVLCVLAIGASTAVPTSAASRPDLIVKAITAPTAVAAGATFSLTHKIKNRGTRTAPVSTAAAYLSADPVFGLGDVPLGTHAVKRIRAGRSATTNATVTVPESTAPDVYSLIVCADATAAVSERSETNNCLASPDQLAVSAPLTTLRVVDPAHVTGHITTPAQLFVDGLPGQPTDIEIYPTGQPGAAHTPLTFVGTESSPSRVLVEIPAGIPVGVYDLTMDGAVAPLSAALTVDDDVEFSINSISPRSAEDDETTRVTIDVEGVDPGTDAYLVPDTGPAIDLHTFMIDTDHVVGTVPAGVSIEANLDIVVVRASGQASFLANAFDVVSSVPAIDHASPRTLPTVGSGTIDLVGSDFTNPFITLEGCVDAAGFAVASPPVVTGASTSTTASATVGSGAAAGTRCVVRLANLNGASADYGPIAFQSAPAAMTELPSGSSLASARKDLALVVDDRRPTNARMYAIGGTDASGATDTVESASIDGRGETGSWRTEHPLPAARTLAGAVRIDRFVYVLGGSDGTGATDSLYRAQILDEDDAPGSFEVYPEFSVAGTLAAGTYAYAVAALFAADDPSNPSGESAATQPVSVDIPAGASSGISWAPVSGATGYRLYRTAVSDTPATNIERIADVSGTTNFTDTGGTTSAVTPRPSGALGSWRTLPAIDPIEGAAVAAAPDPSDPSVHHIYAIGGRDATPEVKTSARYATVTIAPDGSQTVSGQSTGTNTIGPGRYALPAWTVGHEQSANIAEPATYVYIGHGLDEADADSLNLEVALVGAGGDTGTFFAVSSPPAARVRGAAVANNGALFLLGGRSAGVANAGTSATTIGPTLPGLGGWNSAGTLSAARSQSAAVQYGPIAFLVGGVDADGALMSGTARLVD